MQSSIKVIHGARQNKITKRDQFILEKRYSKAFFTIFILPSYVRLSFIADVLKLDLQILIETMLEGIYTTVDSNFYYYVRRLQKKTYPSVVLSLTYASIDDFYWRYDLKKSNAVLATNMLLSIDLVEIYLKLKEEKDVMPVVFDDQLRFLENPSMGVFNTADILATYNCPGEFEDHWNSDYVEFIREKKFIPPPNAKTSLESLLCHYCHTYCLDVKAKEENKTKNK